MTMAHYQLGALIAWIIADFFLLSATVRAFSRKGTTIDDWKAALFFVGLILIAFPSRMLYWPQSECTREILYMCVMGLAALVLTMLWNGRSR